VAGNGHLVEMGDHLFLCTKNGWMECRLKVNLLFPVVAAALDDLRLGVDAQHQAHAIFG
jgi:hypothetical protein